MQQTPPAPSNADLTVFYDGACPLCRSEIGLYRKCGGAERVAFIDVATVSAGDVAEGLDKSAALARFHVQTADGQLHSGAAGFAQLWITLPGWRWLGRLAQLPGIGSVAEVIYCGFLVVRPGIQWFWRRVTPPPAASKAEP